MSTEHYSGEIVPADEVAEVVPVDSPDLLPKNLCTELARVEPSAFLRYVEQRTTDAR